MPLADWKSDLDGIILDFESTLLWDGRYIKCVSSDVREELLVEPEGTYNPNSKEVIVSASEFKTGIPAQKNTVSLDEGLGFIKYYVQDLQNDHQTDMVIFSLKRI